MSVSELLQRRKQAFTLWLPRSPTHPPAVVIGRSWFEVTTNQTVDPNWVGRWALYPGDAKVHVLR